MYFCLSEYPLDCLSCIFTVTWHVHFYTNHVALLVITGNVITSLLYHCLCKHFMYVSIIMSTLYVVIIESTMYCTFSVAATKVSSKFHVKFSGKFWQESLQLFDGTFAWKFRRKISPGTCEILTQFRENIICDSYHIGLIILLAHNWTYRR